MLGRVQRTSSKTLVSFSILAAVLAGACLTASAQQTAARPDRGIGLSSYAISDIESINLTNGNLNLSIPLASLPPIAGGKLSLGWRAVYNSKLWNIIRDQHVPLRSDITRSMAVLSGPKSTLLVAWMGSSGKCTCPMAPK